MKDANKFKGLSADIKIRRATKKDVGDLWLIEIEARKHDKKIIDRRYLQLTQRDLGIKAKREFIKELNKVLGNKKVIILVAETSNEIIGYVYIRFYIWKWSEHPPLCVNMDEVGVLKKYQKKGVATKLMKQAEKLAKKKGAKFVTLDVWKNNKPAIKLYRKNKYENFDTRMVKRLK